MIRTLLEFQIQRYLDDGRLPPSWLTALVRRDARLRKFVDEFNALDDRLLLSAAERRHALSAADDPVVMDSHRKDTFPAAKSRTYAAEHSEPGNRWLYWPAAAAALLLMALMAPMIDSQQRTDDANRVQALSRQLTAMPGEVLDVLTLVADSSQARLSRYSPAAVFLEQDLAAWRSTAGHIIEPAQAVNTWFSKFSDLSQRVRSQFQNDRPLQELLRIKSS